MLAEAPHYGSDCDIISVLRLEENVQTLLFVFLWRFFTTLSERLTLRVQIGVFVWRSASLAYTEGLRYSTRTMAVRMML